MLYKAGWLYCCYLSTIILGLARLRGTGADSVIFVVLSRDYFRGTDARACSSSTAVSQWSLLHGHQVDAD